MLAAQSRYALRACQSGPMGTVVEDQFVVEKPRNQFQFPDDQSLVVACSWEGPPGKLLISGLWTQPDGAIGSISDIRIETKTARVVAYWSFQLTQQMAPGRWRLAIRINGEPAGEHAFDVAVRVPPAPPPLIEAAPDRLPQPKQPTLDELYRDKAPATAWIRKLDETGRRLDSCVGFWLQAGQVITSFQCVDQAAKVEIEFSDGVKVQTDRVLGYHRLLDWIVLAADTGARPVWKRATQPPAIGERLLVFNIEPNDTRTIGGVDLGGRNQLPVMGQRLMLNPNPTQASAGGPLMNQMGEVVGLVGGTMAPGCRATAASRPAARQAAAEVYFACLTTLAIPVDLVKPEGDAQTLGGLRSAGAFTPNITENPNLQYAAMTKRFDPKNPLGPVEQITEISRRDEAFIIYSQWRRVRKDDLGSELVVRLFDLNNQLKGTSQTLPLKMGSTIPVAAAVSFAPAGLAAGFYRADLALGTALVWSGYFRVTD